MVELLRAAYKLASFKTTGGKQLNEAVEEMESALPETVVLLSHRCIVFDTNE